MAPHVSTRSLPLPARASTKSANATTGNSSPFEAWMVMIFTTSPPAPDNAPGASFNPTASSSASARAVEASPRWRSVSRRSTSRTAFSTFAARAVPAAPSSSSRAIHPERTTASRTTVATGRVRDSSRARSNRRTACASRGGSPSARDARRAKPRSRSRRRTHPVSGSSSVVSTRRSSADRRIMSLVSTSNSAAVFAGFASASTKRATTRTSGADANSDPPVTTHSKPSARSASAYMPARLILPSSTTMSPGAWPSSRSAANRRAMASAPARFASAVRTPVPRPAGCTDSTRSMRGALPR